MSELDRAAQTGAGAPAGYAPSIPGKARVKRGYLIVNSEGKILAVLQRGAEVARELARIERDSPTERVTVVRHEEDFGGLASTESFVTVRQLS
jgi:hypothetical protein